MTVLMTREIEKLKKQILSLGALVEESLLGAMRAIDTVDGKLAERIIDEDSRIDQFEVEVEEECLKILALHQPVAIDLRFVVAVLKINNDLERAGDQAVNISKKALVIARAGGLPLRLDFHEIFRQVLAMLRKALDSLVFTDPQKARQVLADDEEIDSLKKTLGSVVIEHLKSNPQNAPALIAALGVLRSCERIGDLATNVAEDVIYMIEGNIIRHKSGA